MKFLATVVSSLLLALISANAESCNNSNFGPHPISKTSFQNVPAHADLGFYAFSFGGSKQYSYQSFTIKLKNTAFLSVTDCYCPGDTFQVFVDGVPLIVTQNPEAYANVSCIAPYYIEDAWACFTGPYHSKSSSILNPGYHNITIATINSAVGGGTGFIRIDTSCTPKNEQPIPCCWIAEADNEEVDYDYTPGRLCNQMVNYP